MLFGAFLFFVVIILPFKIAAMIVNVTYPQGTGMVVEVKKKEEDAK